MFSGFVKSVDPIGTSVFVEKYIATYSIEWMMPISIMISIILGVVEMVLGMMIILRVMLHRALYITVSLLSVFTIITLLNATILPIGDCGCFGEALMLTPLQSLLKNLVMLPIAVWLLYRTPIKYRTWKSVVVVVVLVCASFGISQYSMQHLPLIDFTPYKIGLNLRDAVAKERYMENNSVRNVLIFKNVDTGEIVEYDAANTECWLDESLEYVDVRTIKTNSAKGKFTDFRIYDSEGVECSEELLSCEGRYVWLCVTSKEHLSESLDDIERLLTLYPTSHLIPIASEDKLCLNVIVGRDVYEMDASTMRSFMRARVGVVVIDDGVIIDKRNINDI